MLVRERHQRLVRALGRQPDELELVARARDDVERLRADGAGRTEDQEPFHAAVHDGRGRVTLPSPHGTIHVCPRRPMPTSPPPPARATAPRSARSWSATRPRCCAPAGARSATRRRPPRSRRRRCCRPSRGLSGLRDDGAFGPWLCGIGHNLARRTRRTPAPLPLEAAPEPAAPGPPDREEGARVRAAIAALPPGQRDAVALFYLADLSHAQIAARLGISTGAVKTRLHKARASLQTRLADLRRELPAMPSPSPCTSPTSARPATPALQPRRVPRGGRRRAAPADLDRGARGHDARRPPPRGRAAPARHLPLRRRPARAAGAAARGPHRPPRRDHLLRAGRARGRRLGRRAAERRDQPRARDGRPAARRGGGAGPGRRGRGGDRARSWPPRSPRPATPARSPTSSGVARSGG